jgi:phosphate starvation-inducible PhoH-like protein
MSARKQRQERRNFVPKTLVPKNETQAELLKTLAASESVIVTGPAGTGKTFLTTCYAARALSLHQYAGIVIVRPLVGVGKTSGFLPGSLQRKLEPWSRPLIEALKEHLGPKYEEAAESIEIGSLEHVRGLTYHNTIMIMDEAQNSTVREMKAFLTRIGEESKVFICGDHSQSDLNEDSGLHWAIRAFKERLVPSTDMIEFTHEDIVRSYLCKEWATAFDTLSKR